MAEVEESKLADIEARLEVMENWIHRQTSGLWSPVEARRLLKVLKDIGHA